jgi:hypothetical protein
MITFSLRPFLRSEPFNPVLRPKFCGYFIFPVPAAYSNRSILFYFAPGREIKVDAT